MQCVFSILIIHHLSLLVFLRSSKAPIECSRELYGYSLMCDMTHNYMSLL